MNKPRKIAANGARTGRQFYHLAVKAAGIQAVLDFFSTGT